MENTKIKKAVEDERKLFKYPVIFNSLSIPANLYLLTNLIPELSNIL
jgi:hypothetical protein